MVRDEGELEIDFKFARKYIRDDSADGKNNISKVKSMFSREKFGNGSSTSTEVSGSIGQEEGYSKNPGNRDEDGDNIDILADRHSEKIEFEDKNRVNAIIEQDKSVDNESINLDTINSVNKDSKRN